MFSYKQWRAWLEAKVSEFQADGVHASLRYGPDNGPIPGFGFGLDGHNAIGLLQSWVTGETDYTIHALPNGKMVSHKWMLILTDETFEVIFDEFMVEFQKHDLAPLGDQISD
jgi:hypothetical protein